MATIKLYFDTDKTYPLKINISHQWKSALLPINVNISLDQWDYDGKYQDLLAMERKL